MPSPDAPAHEFIVVDHNTPDLLQQCINVRMAVFIEEQKFEVDTEIDKYDVPGKATHLLLRLVPSSEAIGTIRIVHLSPSEKKIGRLCVLKSYRNFKFGMDLMLEAHKHLVGQLDNTAINSEGDNTILVSLHSQIYVKGFYRKCGYNEVGPEFDEDGAPHQRMELILSGQS